MNFDNIVTPKIVQRSTDLDIKNHMKSSDKKRLFNLLDSMQYFSNEILWGAEMDLELHLIGKNIENS